MSDELFFLDTNIIVYSFDAKEPGKRDIAQKLIRQALKSGYGMISSQVVQEFFNVALNKFTTPLSTGEARRYLDSVLLPLCQVYPGRHYFIQALEIREETEYALYDCFILAAALESGCGLLYSEDLQHTRRVRSLRIVNPFLAPDAL